MKKLIGLLLCGVSVMAIFVIVINALLYVATGWALGVRLVISILLVVASIVGVLIVSVED